MRGYANGTEMQNVLHVDGYYGTVSLVLCMSLISESHTP